MQYRKRFFVSCLLIIGVVIVALAISLYFTEWRNMRTDLEAMGPIGVALGSGFLIVAAVVFLVGRFAFVSLGAA